MIEIKEVTNKKQQREFVNFPLKLYKNNEYFVPPLYMDEMKIFKKNYLYYDTSEAVYYLAYRDGKVVGRISGIIQRSSNEKWKQQRARFTRFDSINDKEVAKALFDAVEKWAKEKLMNEVVGPLGFSDLEREGLLIEGFEELSTFEEQYNYPYYQELIEYCGYGKEVDWLEHKLSVNEQSFERLDKLSTLMMKRYKLKYVIPRNINELIKKYGKQIFEIIDITYDNIYGTVPFTDGMRKLMISNFKLIVKPENVAIIVDENDKIVCFGICFPSIGKAVQKSGGHLTIPTLFRILKAMKKPEILDLALIGVLPQYANKGISTSILAEMMKILKRGNISYAETNLNLEDNHNILNQWKNFNKVQHKRRRAFIKQI